MKDFNDFLNQMNLDDDEDFYNDLEIQANSIDDPVEAAVAVCTKNTLHVLQKYHDWSNS